MLLQDCLDHLQVLGKSCLFAVPALCLSYEIPEVVQQYRILKVPVDCSFHIQTPPFEKSVFPEGFPILFIWEGVKHNSAEGQLHAPGSTQCCLHRLWLSTDPFTRSSQCSRASIGVGDKARHRPKTPVPLLFLRKKA